MPKKVTLLWALTGSTDVVHPLHTGSSGEPRSHSFLPKCHLSSSKLRVLTPRHIFTPPPRTTKGLRPEQHFDASLASRGTNVDLACLTSTRVMLHFTSRVTYVMSLF